MRIIPFSDLRKNLSQTLDSLTEDREPVVITRDRGKPAAVLLLLAEVVSFDQIRHFLTRVCQ